MSRVGLYRVCTHYRVQYKGTGRETITISNDPGTLVLIISFIRLAL